MSASRDSSSRIKFVYSNLYRIYRTAKEAHQEMPIGHPATGLAHTRVIKAKNLNLAPVEANFKKQIEVRAYEPTDLTRHRVEEIREKLEEVSRVDQRIHDAENLVATHSHTAVESLKDNLSQLKSLHTRLRFMLTELEELSSDDKKKK